MFPPETLQLPNKEQEQYIDSYIGRAFGKTLEQLFKGKRIPSELAQRFMEIFNREITYMFEDREVTGRAVFRDPIATLNFHEEPGPKDPGLLKTTVTYMESRFLSSRDALPTSSQRVKARFGVKYHGYEVTRISKVRIMAYKAMKKRKVGRGGRHEGYSMQSWSSEGAEVKSCFGSLGEDVKE